VEHRRCTYACPHCEGHVITADTTPSRMYWALLWRQA
jgi:hypothetical protein